MLWSGMRFPGCHVLALTVALTLLVGCADIVEMPDVAYDDRFGAATTMDFYLPADLDVAVDPARPAVLLIHGGSWRYFDKDGMRFAATRLAGAGYVSASINYRLVPEVIFPDNARDAMCALAFVQANASDFGIDPARIAVMGYSAGGHLASLVGVASDVPELMPDCAAGAPSPPAAVVSGAGPQDMTVLPEFEAVTEMLGGTAEDQPEMYALASPVTHVDADEPPFLFIHGAGDWIANIEHSEAMRDTLIQAGNDARVLALRGGGHVFNPGAAGGDLHLLASSDTPEAWAVIGDFLASTIGVP